MVLYLLLKLLKFSSMKYLCFLFFPVLFIFSGCDNREDFFSEVNKAPSLTILVNNLPIGDNFADSIKLGYGYPVKCQISDDSDKNLSPFLAKSSLLDFAYNYNEVTKEFRLDGMKEGVASAIICVKDSYGALVSKELVFTFFTNIPPVARFSVDYVAEREIDVNASSSFDRDARFGGNVVLFEYDLNGYKFTSYSPIVRYRFPSSGTKVIRLRVKDNSNVFSDVFSKTIVL